MLIIFIIQVHMLFRHLTNIATNTSLTVFGRDTKLASQAEVIITIAIMLGGVERKKSLPTTSSDAVYERYAEIANDALTDLVNAQVSRGDLYKRNIRLLGKCKLTLDKIDDEEVRDDFLIVLKRLFGLLESYEHVARKNMFIVITTTLLALLEDIKNEKVIIR